MEDIRNRLSHWNITFSEEDIQSLLDQIRFPENKSDSISRLERYANGHLFPIFAEKRNPFFNRIAGSLGVTPSDLTIFDTFIRRVIDITSLSHQRNCMLYVDAEQSYM